jgi:RNA polymerase sigma-70 factor (ECF subfamily)
VSESPSRTGTDPVVAAAAAGDGFERFYRREYARVVRLLVGMTGRWALAEELAQEALLSAYREWPRLQELDRPDLWLRRVAINRAVSTHRRLMAELAALARIRAPESTQDEEVNVDELVWSEVRKLPRRQAAALVLWAVEGLTFAEIGGVLACSSETARTHLRRARERLASSLRSEADYDR